MATWSNNNGFNKKYFVKTYLIKDVESNDKISEIDFSLVLNEEGANENVFDHKMRFISKLYRNGNVPVHITNLFTVCGLMNLTEAEKNDLLNNLLSQNGNLEVLKAFFKGKKIKLLKYAYDYDNEKNKFKYKFWKGITDFKNRTNVFDLRTSDEKIEEAFMESVEKGAVNDYKPDIPANNEESPIPNSNIPF